LKLNKNILVITYFFPPLGGVGVQRVSKLCRYLPQFGYDPIVIAPQPSAFYMSDEDMLKEVRHVSLYRVAGIDSFKLREKLGGSFKPRIDSPLRWLSRRFSWPDTQTGFMPAAYGLARKLIKKVDAVFITAPPYSNLLLVPRLKRIGGIPVIIDMRDPWVNHPVHGKLRWKRALNRRAERTAVELADAVLLATKAHLKDMVERYPYLASRFHYIPNGFDPGDFPKSAKRQSRRLRPLTVCYTGVLGLDTINRGTTLYSALRKLRDESNLTPKRLKVDIMGEVSSVEQERIRRSGVSTFINQLGHIPHRKAMQRLAKADLAWLPYHSAYSELIVPAKTYEYIGSGTPILAVINPHHEAAKLVRDTGTGLTLYEDDVDAVASALLKLLAGNYPYKPDWKRISQFSRRFQAKQLAEIIDELTKHN